MNGPFLIERAIFYPLTLVTTLHDHAVGALVRTRPIALGRRTPRADRFARLAGTEPAGAPVGTKVVVLKALGGDPKLPYFAIVAQGFPRLVTVTRDAMVLDSEHQGELPEGVKVRVYYNDDVALVPDLDAAERMITQVLRPAA